MPDKRLGTVNQACSRADATHKIQNQAFVDNHVDDNDLINGNREEKEDRQTSLFSTVQVKILWLKRNHMQVMIESYTLKKLLTFRFKSIVLMLNR